MSTLGLLYVSAGVLCCSAVALAADATSDRAGAIPDFSMGGTAWTSNRPASDDFLPPSPVLDRFSLILLILMCPTARASRPIELPISPIRSLSHGSSLR